jgi:preprotein translocase subunit SecD
MRAGIVGLALVALFLILWYRLPGLVAVVALAIYLLIMLSIFKLIPVVLTAAGVAGFILSIGMAVDANILVFERMKEELRNPKKRGEMQDSIRDGFSRAWTSIRDGNISSILSAIILYMAGTSLTRGFAVTFGLGVIISMISALVVTRTFLLALGSEKNEGAIKFLYGSGFRKS